MVKASRIAAEIALSQTTEVLSLDGCDFDNCEGWYIADHSLIITFSAGSSDSFFDYCIRRAGSVSSIGQSITFERAMHELHNDWGGNTWSVGKADLIRRGWIRFVIQAGKVMVYTGDRQAVSLLTMLLLPYASKSMVLNDWRKEYEVREPSEAQVQETLQKIMEESK